jgi:hypothetical protein
VVLRRPAGLKRWLLALFLAGLLLRGLPLAAAHAAVRYHPAQLAQVLARHHSHKRPAQPGLQAGTIVRSGTFGLARGAGNRATGAPAPLGVSLVSPHQPRAPPPR